VLGGALQIHGDAQLTSEIWYDESNTITICLTWSAMKLESHQVLRISKTGKPQNTVRRHYLEWRVANGMPRECCDNKECFFNTSPLTWNNEPLKPILDHVSGNRRDNSPKNLRFLCPNCDSQNYVTKSGANAGRIKIKGEKGSYQVYDRDGTVAAHAAGEHFTSNETIFLPGATTVTQQ
jgi:hypothetical protein